ncbi:MAG: YlmC/YmxH family sporulation protein [Oscillospiraceae bacterium]|nr:YlmC/YmxH family sporulation protein [Oscillospiraceae bacterium]
MQCRITELRDKEIVNVCDGQRLGFVYDVMLNAATGQIIALIVPGPCKFLGLFGKTDDYVIPWECIRRIGPDIIIIEVTGPYRREKRRKTAIF